MIFLFSFNILSSAVKINTGTNNTSTLATSTKQCEPHNPFQHATCIKKIKPLYFFKRVSVPIKLEWNVMFSKFAKSGWPINLKHCSYFNYKLKKSARFLSTTEN